MIRISKRSQKSFQTPFKVDSSTKLPLDYAYCIESLKSCNESFVDSIKWIKDRKNPKYCYSVDFQSSFDMNYTDSRNNPMNIVFPKKGYHLRPRFRNPWTGWFRVRSTDHTVQSTILGSHWPEVPVQNLRLGRYPDKPLESWFKSRDVCRAFGGELLSITSSQEFYFIKNLLLSSSSAGAIWLGLNDLLKEGIWEWTDKSPLNLANWIDGQPNSYGGSEFSSYHTY